MHHPNCSGHFAFHGLSFAAPTGVFLVSSVHTASMKEKDLLGGTKIKIVPKI